MITENELGDIEINKTNCILLSKEGEYALSKNEVLLLELFYTNPNEIFSNDEISTACWPGRVVSQSSVPVAIKRVRDLLKKTNLRSKIITHKGEGYSFSLEDSVKIRFIESEYCDNNSLPHTKSDNIISVKFIVCIFALFSMCLCMFLSNLEWNEVSVKYSEHKKIKIITNVIDKDGEDFTKYNKGDSVFIDRTNHSVICNEMGCWIP
ncbi:hypothetical protein JNC30_004663 [Salmonella enterica]|nr:hypothetical protein [Salmonella enterica]EGM3390166.1 hypothetical protein [Salmonella enterica]EHE3387875.1 hypothetical protein [Salmonella enterica]